MLYVLRNEQQSIKELNPTLHYEARQKEQIYFIELQATLNSIEPMPKQKHKKAAVNPAEKNGSTDSKFKEIAKEIAFLIKLDSKLRTVN